MAGRALITHNFGWKVVSLALAILIWAAVRSGLQDDLGPAGVRVFPHLPITVMTAAADERAYRVEPETADVALRAPPQVLRELRSSDLEVYVNLTAGVDGHGAHKRIQVYAPAGVTVKHVNPPDVSVEVLPAPSSRPVSPTRKP